ncbi:AgrD family cyclic lactone autoinducer peptide [Pedobacter sp. KBS0701]
MVLRAACSLSSSACDSSTYQPKAPEETR